MAWLGEPFIGHSADTLAGHTSSADRPVTLRPYTLTTATRNLILEAFLDGIVIALVKLDETSDASVVKMVRSASNSTASSRVHTPKTDGGQSGKSGSFFDLSDKATETSPPPALDTEQGRFVALCIIGGLADSGIVAAEVLRERILPLVTKITRHPSDLLRKQAAETLALMLQWLDDGTIGKTFVRRFVYRFSRLLTLASDDELCPLGARQGGRSTTRGLQPNVGHCRSPHSSIWLWRLHC